MSGLNQRFTKPSACKKAREFESHILRNYNQEMKILSLNLWGGRIYEPLAQFIQKNGTIDIFCFQEMYHDAHEKETLWTDDTRLNLLLDIQKMLPNHTCIYHPHLDTYWGLAMFVKNDIAVLEEGDKFVHKENGWNPEMEVQGHTAKNIQYIKIKKEDKEIFVMNFHGLWNGQGKTDTEERINQSKNILEFMRELPGEFVLCGDFNLLPTTESLKMFEASGLRNLIQENRIISTRTSYYTKPDKFADYAFVTKGLIVKDFKVLPDEVSDHSPLYLEIG
jgi:endonuclease/exonuclease/phosphatase family metal-dependent hydrolase